MALAQTRVNLEEWIRDALADSDYEGPCTAIALQHMTGPAESEIKTAKIGGGRAWTDTDLANYLYKLAKGHVQDLSGVHTFRLVAFFNNSNQWKLQHSFLVAGQADNNGLGTEQPNPQGKMAQGMRHEELLIQTMMQERLAIMQAAFKMNDQSMTMIQSLAKDLHETRREAGDAFKVVAEVMLKEATRNNAHEIAMMQFKRATNEREKLLAFVPYVANKIFPGLIPEQASDTAMFEYMAEHMSAEDFAKIAATGAVPAEVLGMIQGRLADILKKKRLLEEEAAARGNEAETDAADDPVLPENAGPNGVAGEVVSKDQGPQTH